MMGFSLNSFAKRFSPPSISNTANTKQSWLDKLLNTTTKIVDSNNSVKIAQATGGYQTNDYNPPVLSRNTPVSNNSQGEVAGAVVGNFADKSVNFLKQNWLIVGLVVGGYVLYQTQPKRNGVKRNGQKLFAKSLLK